MPSSAEVTYRPGDRVRDTTSGRDGFITSVLNVSEGVLKIGVLFVGAALTYDYTTRPGDKIEGLELAWEEASAPIRQAVERLRNAVHTPASAQKLQVEVADVHQAAILTKAREVEQLIRANGQDPAAITNALSHGRVKDVEHIVRAYADQVMGLNSPELAGLSEHAQGTLANKIDAVVEQVCQNFGVPAQGTVARRAFDQIAGLPHGTSIPDPLPPSTASPLDAASYWQHSHQEMVPGGKSSKATGPVDPNRPRRRSILDRSIYLEDFPEAPRRQGAVFHGPVQESPDSLLRTYQLQQGLKDLENLRRYETAPTWLERRQTTLSPSGTLLSHRPGMEQGPLSGYHHGVGSAAAGPLPIDPRLAKVSEQLHRRRGQELLRQNSPLDAPPGLQDTGSELYLGPSQGRPPSFVDELDEIVRLEDLLEEQQTLLRNVRDQRKLVTEMQQSVWNTRYRYIPAKVVEDEAELLYSLDPRVRALAHQRKWMPTDGGGATPVARLYEYLWGNATENLATDQFTNLVYDLGRIYDREAKRLGGPAVENALGWAWASGTGVANAERIILELGGDEALARVSAEVARKVQTATNVRDLFTETRESLGKQAQDIQDEIERLSDSLKELRQQHAGVEAFATQEMGDPDELLKLESREAWERWRGQFEPVQTQGKLKRESWDFDRWEIPQGRIYTTLTAHESEVLTTELANAVEVDLRRKYAKDEVYNRLLGGRTVRDVLTEAGAGGAGRYDLVRIQQSLRERAERVLREAGIDAALTDVSLEYVLAQGLGRVAKTASRDVVSDPTRLFRMAELQITKGDIIAAAREVPTNQLPNFLDARRELRRLVRRLEDTGEVTSERLLSEVQNMAPAVQLEVQQLEHLGFTEELARQAKARAKENAVLGWHTAGEVRKLDLVEEAVSTVLNRQSGPVGLTLSEALRDPASLERLVQGPWRTGDQLKPLVDRLQGLDVEEWLDVLEERRRRASTSGSDDLIRLLDERRMPLKDDSIEAIRQVVGGRRGVQARQVLAGWPGWQGDAGVYKHLLGRFGGESLEDLLDKDDLNRLKYYKGQIAGAASEAIPEEELLSSALQSWLRNDLGYSETGAQFTGDLLMRYRAGDRNAFREMAELRTPGLAPMEVGLDDTQLRAIQLVSEGDAPEVEAVFSKWGINPREAYYLGNSRDVPLVDALQQAREGWSTSYTPSLMPTQLRVEGNRISYVDYLREKAVEIDVETNRHTGELFEIGVSDLEGKRLDLVRGKNVGTERELLEEFGKYLEQTNNLADYETAAHNVPFDPRAIVGRAELIADQIENLDEQMTWRAQYLRRFRRTFARTMDTLEIERGRGSISSSLEAAKFRVMGSEEVASGSSHSAGFDAWVGARIGQQAIDREGGTLLGDRLLAGEGKLYRLADVGHVSDEFYLSQADRQAQYVLEELDLAQAAQGNVVSTGRYHTRYAPSVEAAVNELGRLRVFDPSKVQGNAVREAYTGLREGLFTASPDEILRLGTGQAVERLQPYLDVFAQAGVSDPLAVHRRALRRAHLIQQTEGGSGQVFLQRYWEAAEEATRGAKVGIRLELPVTLDTTGKLPHGLSKTFTGSYRQRRSELYDFLESEYTRLAREAESSQTAGEALAWIEGEQVRVARELTRGSGSDRVIQGLIESDRTSNSIRNEAMLRYLGYQADEGSSVEALLRTKSSKVAPWRLTNQDTWNLTEQITAETGWKMTWPQELLFEDHPGAGNGVLAPIDRNVYRQSYDDTKRLLELRAQQIQSELEYRRQAGVTDELHVLDVGDEAVRGELERFRIQRKQTQARLFELTEVATGRSRAGARAAAGMYGDMGNMPVWQAHISPGGKAPGAGHMPRVSDLSHEGLEQVLSYGSSYLGEETYTELERMYLHMADAIPTQGVRPIAAQVLPRYLQHATLGLVGLGVAVGLAGMFKPEEQDDPVIRSQGPPELAPISLENARIRVDVENVRGVEGQALVDAIKRAAPAHGDPDMSVDDQLRNVDPAYVEELIASYMKD